MQIVANLIIKFFVITLAGLALKKTGMIPEALEKGLNQLLLKVILPINILVSSQNAYSEKAAANMLLTAGIAAGYYLISIIISNVVSRATGLDENGRRVFIAATVFGNVGFIGFPVAGELYGTEGVLYAVVYNVCFQLLFFTYGVSLLSGENHITPKVLLKNPVTICSLISVLFFLLQIPIQEGISSAMSSVGGMTAPVSLLLIGCSLSTVKVKDILLDKYAYLVSVFRMIIYPSVLFLILIYCKLPTVVAGTCAVLTSLPAGSLNVMYAQEHNCSPQYASRSIIQTMLFMIVTLPVMLILINLFL